MTNTGAWDTVRYAIDAERRRQDKLWGVQDHDHFTWLAILTEEVGELGSQSPVPEGDEDDDFDGDFDEE